MDIRQVIWAAGFAAIALASPAAAAPVPALDDSEALALILIPLTLTKIDDLDFGGVIASSASGTVTINPGTGVRTFTGGTSGLASEAGNRAYFGGAGSPNQQVLVAISPPTELVSVGGDTIPVTGLTLDGAPMRSIDPDSRTFFVGVGGTLAIAADQAPGDYNAEFWVTAIYQ